MPAPAPQFHVSLAATSADIQAAQRLRYDVFVAELGASGLMVDDAARLEADPFDQFADHLILRDLTRSADQQVVGVYRLMTSAHAARADGFSCGGEYDLAPLLSLQKTVVELSRSCLHPAYRGGTAMFHLWQALAAYIAEKHVDILFGVASFHGTDVQAHAPALALLFADHASPYPVTSRAPRDMPVCAYDRKAALRQMPALIKAYLRLGGAVGQGVFVDQAFNTTDVCMILEVNKMRDRHKAIYSR